MDEYVEVVTPSLEKIENIVKKYKTDIDSLDLKPLIGVLLKEGLKDIDKTHNYFDLKSNSKQLIDVKIPVSKIKALGRADICDLNRLEKILKEMLKGIAVSTYNQPIDVIKYKGEYYLNSNGNHRAVIMILFQDWGLCLPTIRANVKDYDINPNFNHLLKQ